MTRWLAGSFDRRGRGDSSRLSGALAPQTASIVEQGPLRVAYSGPASDTQAPLCLLDGFLDNASELSATLRVPADLSPEELLAAGWRRWGAELPPRLRGDFALLIWDQERGEGILARDQLGIRSIFLCDTPGGICFANELRHLLRMLPRRPAPDSVGVAHWISGSGRPGSGTLYAGVRRLDPGAIVLLGASGTHERPYWEPRFVEPLDVRAPELASRIREAMTDAVRRRLDPASGTGVMMSGGLDSASVAAIAAEQAPGRVSAYSAAFPEHPSVDESALIAELRNALSLPGVTAEVRAGGLVTSALQATRSWELPLASWGDFWATALLGAASSRGIKVMLGGDGGDELFGARFWLLSDRLRRGHPLQALALARELPGAGDHPPRRALAKALRDFGLAGVLPHRLSELAGGPFARRSAPAWMLPRTARELAESSDPFAWKRLDGPSWWASTAHVLTRGVEESGVFEDHRHRASVGGLEARHPLFDLDVLELALRQPPELTFDRYRDRPTMRSSMAGLLPDSVRLRPRKALFDEILVDGLAGLDRQAVHQLLGDPTAELGAYIDISAVRSELPTDDLSVSYSPQWIQQLWRLVTAECWLRAQANPDGDVLAEDLRASKARVSLQPADGPAT